eukprot:SAG22_NODE_131_length_18561_cov_10.941387_6_plen_159_part_00
MHIPLHVFVYVLCIRPPPSLNKLRPLQEHDGLKRRYEKIRSVHSANGSDELLEEELRLTKLRLKCSVETGAWKEVRALRSLHNRQLKSQIGHQFVTGSHCTDRPRCGQVVIAREGCYHMFSRKCTDTLIKNRNRKCPICNQRFDVSQVIPIHGLAPDS